MTGTIGNIGDKFLTGSLWITQQSINSFNDNFYNVNILPFVETADIVGITRLTIVENNINSTSMIHDIKPVTNILTLSIDRQGLAVADIVNKEGNKLLRELVGTVVIRAVRHQSRHAIGVVIGAHEVVAAGLGGTVGAVRVVLGRLDEELATIGGRTFGLVELQSAVHLIRRDVVEALAFPIAVPILTSSLQQAERTHHVGTGESKGVFDGAIHVALGSEVNNAVDIVLLHDGAHALEVTYISLHKSVIRLVLDIFQVSEIAGIGEGVEVNDFVLRVLVDEETNNVGTDEAGTACD